MRAAHCQTSRPVYVFLLLVWFLPGAAAAAPARISYRLVDTWTEGNEATTAYDVAQQGRAAVARAQPGGSVALVSNPGAGIRAARQDSSLPFLVDVMDVLPEIGRGTRLPGRSGVEVIRSVEYHLERGQETRTLLGHEARHSVLTIEVDWDSIQEDGSRNSNRSIGHADLWTAADLPFSWLPYATPTGFSMAAVPLSFHHPKVASYVIDKLAPKLEELGLLLEADARSSIVLRAAGKEASQDFARRVSVEDLKQGAGPLDTDVFDLPALTETRYEALLGALVAASQSCSKPPSPPGTLQIDKETPRRIVGQGRAAVVPASEANLSELVLGSLQGEPACWVFTVDPSGPEAARYPIGIPSRTWKIADPPKAAGFYLHGSRTAPLATVLEAGALTVTAGKSGDLVANLKATGWTAGVNPAAPSFTDDVTTEMTFDIITPGPEEAATEPPVAQAWAAQAFDASQRSPAAEWNFDGNGVTAGAIDSNGRYAAVGVAGRPQIALLDLETRTEVGRMDTPAASSGRHVKSLAFSPSGAQMAIGAAMGRVVIADTATLQKTHELQYSRDGHSFVDTGPVAFASGGKRLLQISGKEVVIWDPVTGKQLTTWTAAGTGIQRLSVTPDGQYAATSDPRESVRVWNVARQEEICALPGSYSALAVHPSGDRFAAVTYDKRVVIASMSDCAEITTWPVDLKFSPSIAWAVDGRHVILGSATGAIHLYADDGTESAVWTGQARTSFVFTAPGSGRVLSTALGSPSRALLWEAR